MESLKTILSKAQKSDYVIPHFNISSIEQWRGIAEAGKKYSAPIIIGMSENEANYFGYELAVKCVRYFSEQYNLPIFISADHHKSYGICKKALEAGFDGVHIDASELEFDENILLTQKVVALAKTYKREISVEGELGRMTEQTVNKEKILAGQTNSEQVCEYILKTDIDRLAISVGSVHGLEKAKTHLNFSLLDKIQNQLSTPRVENGGRVCLTLHGGSGVANEDVKKALKYFSNIHINTELRKALKNGLEKAVRLRTIKPYEYLSVAIDEVKKIAEDKIKLFNN